MTSSFDTQYFTESSFIKSLARFAVLPSILAVSLTLTACQEASVPGENDVQTENANEVDSNAATLENDEFKAAEMSTEEQMIANLTRYRWTLMSASDKGAQPLNTLLDIKDQVRLSFSQYQGENQLTLVLDANVENGSAESATAESRQPILTQITSDAATLVWAGKLTSQAKYNSKGETVFWAVNAKKVACADKSSELCLQVKPITYDDQGIKVSEGEWTAFNGEIDGYQPDGMHDEVLRLQRYQLDANENEEAQEYAYVLDAVIESSVVE